MGLRGFEPRPLAPEARILAKFDYSPILSVNKKQYLYRFLFYF